MDKVILKHKLTVAILEHDIASMSECWRKISPEERCDPYYTYVAVSSDNLAALSCLHVGGGKWNEITCCLAAKLGRRRILEFLRENGCPWDFRTAFGAVEFGSLEILKWVLEKGCEFDKYQLLAHAVNYKRYDIVTWMLSNYDCYTPIALEIPFIRGDDHMFNMIAEYVMKHY